MGSAPRIRKNRKVSKLHSSILMMKDTSQIRVCRKLKNEALTPSRFLCVCGGLAPFMNGGS
jgi:hypothetical protein